MATFSLTLPIRTSFETLWKRIQDVRWVAGLFPYVDIEEFHEPAPDRWRYWRRLAIPTLADMRWEEEATVSGEGKLDFRAIAGDLETFVGHWLVAPNGHHAQLSLNVDYAIPDGLGPVVPPVVATHVLNEVFKTICERVKEAVEEGHA